MFAYRYLIQDSRNHFWKFPAQPFKHPLSRVKPAFWYELPVIKAILGAILFSVARKKAQSVIFLFKEPLQLYDHPVVTRPGGGGTPLYGLYRYVPRNRVWFLRFSILK